MSLKIVKASDKGTVSISDFASNDTIMGTDANGSLKRFSRVDLMNDMPIGYYDDDAGTPALSGFESAGNVGKHLVVKVAGSNYAAGSKIFWDGTVWQEVPQTDTVSDGSITPAKTNFADTLTEAEEAYAVTSAITSTHSENVYNGDSLNGYINGATGLFAAEGSGNYKTTGLIPVKADTFYQIVNRKSPTSTNIRCVDENGENPTKVRIAETGLEYATWATPLPDGSAAAITGNSVIKTSSTAAYLQFILAFNEVLEEFDEVSVQEMGATYDLDFIPKPYRPYEQILDIKKTALPKVQSNETLNLWTTQNLLLIGSSFVECYGALKDKSFVSYLSAFTDYYVETFARTGSTYIEHFNAVINEIEYGENHPRYLNGGVAIIMLGGNEQAYRDYGIDAKYFEKNIKRFVNLLEAFGYRVVLTSYFGDQRSPWPAVVSSTAKKLGLSFWDMNAYGSKYFSPPPASLYYNGHYATRTNSQQWYPLIKLIEQLDRPRTGVKVFRNRISSETLSDFNFNDKYRKLKYWREVSLPQYALKSSYEKYVDRLDIAGGSSIELIDSEYQQYREGTPFSIAEKALVQITLPSTARNLDDLTVRIECTGSPSFYVKKYNDSSEVIDLTGQNAGYTITTADPTIVAGDTYTDSGNAGVNFTVIEYSNGFLIMEGDDTFTTPGSTSGTLTRTSGTGTASLTYNKLISVPPSSYFTDIETEQGLWESVTPSSHVITLGHNSYYRYMDYDTIYFLVTSDSAFEIKDIEARYVVTREKESKAGSETLFQIEYDEPDTQLLAVTDFDDPENEWNAPSGVFTWNGRPVVGGATQYHIPSFYNTKGLTSIIRLDAGDAISQSVSTMYGNRWEIKKFKIKIVGRYYPTLADDIDALPADVRTSSTFDFGRIAVSYKITNTSYYTQEVYLTSHFLEHEIDVLFDSDFVDLTSNNLIIKAIDDNIELLEVEVFG